MEILEICRRSIQYHPVDCVYQLMVLRPYREICISDLAAIKHSPLDGLEWTSDKSLKFPFFNSMCKDLPMSHSPRRGFEFWTFFIYLTRGSSFLYRMGYGDRSLLRPLHLQLHPKGLQDPFDFPSKWSTSQKVWPAYWTFKKRIQKVCRDGNEPQLIGPHNRGSVCIGLIFATWWFFQNLWENKKSSGHILLGDKRASRRLLKFHKGRVISNCRFYGRDMSIS